MLLKKRLFVRILYEMKARVVDILWEKEFGHCGICNKPRADFETEKRMHQRRCIRLIGKKNHMFVYTVALQDRT